MNADLYRRLANLLREGTVHEVRHTDPPRLRVATGDLITDWLPWLELRAGTTVTWSPPTQGEQCLVLAPDGDLTAGVVLVGVYSDSRPAPTDSEFEDLRHYPDGARIDHNHQTSEMVIEVPASGSLRLICGASSITLTNDGITAVAPRIDLN